MTIDLDAALDGLQLDFDRALAERMPEYREVASEALQRLHLRRGAERVLVRGFSPLVVLYPALVAEGLGDSNNEVIRRVSLAHLLLLVHTFLEDRHLDAELDTRREERLFCRRLFLESRRVLKEGLGNHQLIASMIDDREAEYMVGQLARYRDGGGQVRPWPAVRAIVIARAALGSIGWEALALHSQISATRYKELKEGFRALVVGMQWEDDLIDWRADRSNGAENLLSALDDGLDIGPADWRASLPTPARTAVLPPLLQAAFRALRREWVIARRCLGRGTSLDDQLAVRMQAIRHLEEALAPKQVS